MSLEHLALLLLDDLSSIGYLLLNLFGEVVDGHLLDQHGQLVFLLLDLLARSYDLDGLGPLPLMLLLFDSLLV